MFLKYEKHVIEMYCFWNKAKIIHFYISSEHFKFQIGFGKEAKFNQTEQKEYKEILSEVFNILETNIKNNDCWLWIEIEPLGNYKNIQEFLDYYTNIIPTVLERFQSKKKYSN